MSGTFLKFVEFYRKYVVRDNIIQASIIGICLNVNQINV